MVQINQFPLLAFFLNFINFISSQETISKKCRVLALEGGGDRGAFQAGAISGLVNNLPPEKVQWDVVTGISIGSINTLMFGVYPVGKETNASNDLLDHWMSISSANIYQNWPWLGPLYGMVFENSIFDTSNGFTFLNKTINKYNGLKRDVIFGTTNVETSEYETYTNKDLLTSDDIANALLSSAAIPVAFPFGTLKNNSYMDGGVSYSVDVFSGVNKCEDKGFEQKDIIVDIVLCKNSSISIKDPKSLTPVGSLFRFMEINSFESAMAVISDTKHYMRDVTLRYVVAPLRSMPISPVAITFWHKDIVTMIKYGQEDAKTIIEKGVGVHANELLKKRNEKKFARYASTFKKKNDADAEEVNKKESNLRFLK